MHCLRTLDELCLLDLGCSAGLDEKWKCLQSKIHLVGLDPDAAECERLSKKSSGLRRTQYIPMALAGKRGKHKIYHTRFSQCTSLLQPNTAWLKRFSFRHLFSVINESEVECETLDSLLQTHPLRIDIMKMDVQGMELPILRAGKNVMQRVCCIETETGFTRNYMDETVFWEISQFMEQHHFLLFDLEIHRASRVNGWSHPRRQQPLWCNALWLKDYISADETPDEHGALALLEIALKLGYRDFAWEAHQYFLQKNVFSHPVISDPGLIDRWSLLCRKVLSLCHFVWSRCRATFSR